MKVAVVDIGSNTVRLLVAATDGDRVVPVREEREHVLLGEEVERHGSIRPAKLAETAVCARRYARLARDAGAVALDVLVTAPGRQSSNAEELLSALAAATGAAVRVLSPEEEGRLAFTGAVAALRRPPDSVAVCDVGGGSTEVVLGTPSDGPAWTRGLDLGCVRLTERLLGEDPPAAKSLAAVRAEIDRHLEGFAPPLPHAAYAAGGTARSLRKLVGRTLGEAEFAAALAIFGRRPSARIAKTFGIHPRRARTLPAGALVLEALHRRLLVPLEVSRAGLREGAALSLQAEAAAAWSRLGRARRSPPRLPRLCGLHPVRARRRRRTPLPRR
jgi:exopolyphosphatase/guanosine-5'-triphosphate,3'-diphosphate pyrophosphatase